MPISQERFLALVSQLEVVAKERPTSYKLRVALLASLGYAYIFFVLAILLCLIGLLILFIVTGHFNYAIAKLVIVLVALALIILRSLWVRLEPPQGIPLQASLTPRLFQAVEEIRQALRGPKVHQVLLTDDFNAAISQVPRLGLFGWQMNYLIVGLPLMQALSPDQFRAILAHEYGHLSGAHGRFGAWIYRIRKTSRDLKFKTTKLPSGVS